MRRLLRRRARKEALHCQTPPDRPAELFNTRKASVESSFQFGPLQLDASRRTVCRGKQLLHLTPKEFDILHYLLEHPHRVVEKAELLSKLWPGVVVEESNLTQNIFLLRKALGASPSGEPFIETVPKRGYRIAVPVRRRAKLPQQVKRAAAVALLLAWGVLCYWLGSSHFF